MEIQKSATNLVSTALSQYRQLSIPLWTRILVVLLVVVVFIGNASFFVFALIEHRDKWIDASVTIFGTTFFPTIAVLYVAFAETGTKALGKKTLDLLTKIVPACFENIHANELPVEMAGRGKIAILPFVLEVRGTTCRYVVDVVKHGVGCPDELLEQLHLTIDVNVSKANVLLMVRSDLLSSTADVPVLSDLQSKLPHTIEGAILEDYKLNPRLKPIQIDGSAYVGLTITKRLPPDFLWDPAQKLYFAQDIALFIASALAEGQFLFPPQK